MDSSKRKRYGKRKRDVEKNKAPLSDQATVEKALSIIIIFENIMSMLPAKDILNCGLINKNWFEKTRENVREKRKCIAQIGANSTCQKLQNFAKTFQHSQIIPYNGLSMGVACRTSGWEKSCKVDRRRSLDSYNVTSRMIIKHLEILTPSKPEGYLGGPTCCVINKVLENILQKDRSTLISINLLCPSRFLLERLFKPESIKKILDDLNHLEINPEPKNHNSSFIDSLIASTPKLSVLKGFLSNAQLNSLISQGKSQIVKELVIFKKGSELLYTRFAETNPKLEVLTIPQPWYWKGPQLSRFIPTWSLILRSSCNSVREMNLYVSVLRVLSINFEVPFKNLEILRVHYCLQLDRNVDYWFLKSIPGMFPNVTTLELHLTGDIPYFMGMIKTEEFEGLRQVKATSVRKLILKCDRDAGGWGGDTLAALRRLFPNVKHLELEWARWGQESIVQQLWRTWEELETLELHVEDENVRENMDRIFCGNSKKKENSIRNLKHLKWLKLKIDHSTGCIPQNDGTAFITEITGKLAFSKMPGLSVRIFRDECVDRSSRRPKQCCFNFRNLEPFAEILPADLEKSWKRFDFYKYKEKYLPV